jgi:hypothetical protein
MHVLAAASYCTALAIHASGRENDLRWQGDRF